MMQEGGLCKGRLCCFERLIAITHPGDLLVFTLGCLVERMQLGGKARHEAAVKIYHPQEPLQVNFRLRHWNIPNCSDPRREWCNSVSRHEMSKIVELTLSKKALLPVDDETVGR